MGSRSRREWRTKSDGVTTIENRAEEKMVRILRGKVMERGWSDPRHLRRAGNQYRSVFRTRHHECNFAKTGEGYDNDPIACTKMFCLMFW